MKRFETPPADTKRPLSFGERQQELARERKARLEKKRTDRTRKKLEETAKKLEGLQKTAESDSRALEESTRIARMAEKDPLTGLANRAEFGARLDVLVKKWQTRLPDFVGHRSEDPAQLTSHIDKRKSNDFVVIMIDIDHFKAVNDTLGHAAGDEVLKLVAKALSSGDVLRASDFPARYGGEEFVVLCPETEIEGGQKVAEKIREAVETLDPTYSGRVSKITVSAGVSSAATTLDINKIVSRADVALYQAKARGRNRVEKALPTRHISSRTEISSKE
ncbi:MAG: GGDEF domain-containing protein [Patescibacteria group bacterium]